MTHYLVELYSANPAWKALSVEQRTQYLNSVATAMSGLTAAGVQPLTLTPIKSGVDQCSEHQFLAIWRFPDQETCDALLEGIKASGWYSYFNHINAVGQEVNFSSHLAALSGI